MKLTLLDMVQSILSSLSSDEVNSYSDTSESIQVANIIKETYFNMLSKYDLPENNQLFQLNPSNSEAQPTLMYKPEGISGITWVKYFDTNPSDGNSQSDQYGSYNHDLNSDIVPSNNSSSGAGPGYIEVKILSIEEFLKIINRFDTTASNVGTFELTVINQHSESPDTFKFNYENDHRPKFCCIVSDYYIIFDAYDQTQDATLQSSKTQCYGWVLPEFKMEDTFVPALEDNIFPLLLSEAKSLAFLELKQQLHQKAEQEVKRQLSSLQKFKAVSKKPSYFEQLPDFGRHGSGWI
jgi:hypothetical protein